MARRSPPLLSLAHTSALTDPFPPHRDGRSSEERRVEVDLRKAVPASAKTADERTDWVQSEIGKIGQDLKHSSNWSCEFCGQPARETIFQFASWMHLTPPRLVVYVHAFCKVDAPECRAKYLMLVMQTASASGIPTKIEPVTSSTVQYPLLASCLGCEKDSTAERSGGKLKRCSGCKLTRYCSQECQTSHWATHKRACKMIKAVRWIKGHGIPSPPPAFV